MDLDWKCPFTGKTYDALQLPYLEREHVIPYADRPTNALSALVLTFDWVNKLKGKRTGIEFIKAVEADDRFLTPKQYEAFVKKLKVAQKDSYPDDYRRQSTRKKLMLVEHFEVKDQGFTQGALTQTSHLNRLSARQLEKKFIDPSTGEPTVRIHSIPGQITAEIRKSWRLIGTMAQACPEILHPSIDALEAEATAKAKKELKKQIKAKTLTIEDEEGLIQTFIERIPTDQKAQAGTPKNKTDIRGITHLHHALDACTIALAHHYLPGRFRGQKENEKGAIWAAMLKRNKSEADVTLLKKTGLFKVWKKTNRREGEAHKQGKPIYDARLIDIPKDLKNNISKRLAEKRVIQHIPADQSGAILEQNAWRLRHHHSGICILTQKGSDGPSDSAIKTSIAPNGAASYTRKKKLNSPQLKKIKELIDTCPSHTFSHKEINLIKRGVIKIKSERASKVIGLQQGKLSCNQSTLTIPENYGIAILKHTSNAYLEAKIVVIPHHNIPITLSNLSRENNNVPFELIKNGSCLCISNGKYQGYWRFFTIDRLNPFTIKVAQLDRPKFTKTLILNTAIKDGLKVLTPHFTGITVD